MNLQGKLKALVFGTGKYERKCVKEYCKRKKKEKKGKRLPLIFVSECGVKII